MSITQFRKLKKQIDLLLTQFEKEAVEKGVNIISTEFLDLEEKLKEKILLEKGIMLEEYERLELELENEELGASKEIILGMAKDITEKDNIREIEFKKNIEKIKEELLSEIVNNSNELTSRIKSIGDNILEVKSTYDNKISGLSADVSSLATKFNNDLSSLAVKINKSIQSIRTIEKIKEIKLDKTETDLLKKDLFYLQENFSEWTGKLQNIYLS